MSHTPHELREDFPEYLDKIHELKTTDKHFVKLESEYHDLNREIHRIEIGEEHISQLEEEKLRKKRMLLKDAIYHCLKEA